MLRFGGRVAEDFLPERNTAELHFLRERRPCHIGYCEYYDELCTECGVKRGTGVCSNVTPGHHYKCCANKKEMLRMHRGPGQLYEVKDDQTETEKSRSLALCFQRDGRNVQAS